MINRFHPDRQNTYFHRLPALIPKRLNFIVPADTIYAHCCCVPLSHSTSNMYALASDPISCNHHVQHPRRTNSRRPRARTCNDPFRYQREPSPHLQRQPNVRTHNRLRFIRDIMIRSATLPQPQSRRLLHRRATFPTHVSSLPPLIVEMGHWGHHLHVPTKATVLGPTGSPTVARGTENLCAIGFVGNVTCDGLEFAAGRVFVHGVKGETDGGAFETDWGVAGLTQ
jgi:hypothetical protein